MSTVTSPSAAPGASPPRVTYLVKRLEMALRSNLDEATSGLGLTTPQYAALSSLLQRPGVTSAELARMSFTSAQAAHQMISSMARRGLIRREVSPHHRKELRIFLTDHGRECLRHCEERADLLEQVMFADLSAEEQATLARLLGKCSDALTGGRRERSTGQPALG